MKKLIDFCKSYLAEVLFALITVILICVYAICWWQLNGYEVGLCGTAAMVLEMGIAFGLAHLLPDGRKSYKVAHYLCFGLWTVVFIVSIIFSACINKVLWILFIFSGVAFCALFSDLIVVTHLVGAEKR